MRFKINRPVGNNLENDDEDVLQAKRAFSKAGYYNRPVENGIIDRELDDAILAFQYDNDLKPDRIMNPGGETEVALNTVLKQTQSDDTPESELPPIPPKKPSKPPLPERKPDFGKDDNFFDSLKETMDNLKDNEKVKDLIEQLKDHKKIFDFLKSGGKLNPQFKIMEEIIKHQRENDDGVI